MDQVYFPAELLKVPIVVAKYCYWVPFVEFYPTEMIKLDEKNFVQSHRNAKLKK